MTRQKAQDNLMSGVRVYQKLPPKKQRIAAALDSWFQDVDRVFNFSGEREKCLNLMKK